MPDIEQKSKPLNYDEIVKRLVEAVIKRLEGGDDPRKKYDYLAKLDDETLKTMSVLTESQIDSVAECSWLASTFPSMMPLKNFGESLAGWSPSKGGRRADQVTATMISQETHVVPQLINSNPAKPDNKKEKKKDKDGED